MVFTTGHVGKLGPDMHIDMNRSTHTYNCFDRIRYTFLGRSWSIPRHIPHHILRHNFQYIDRHRNYSPSSLSVRINQHPHSL